MSLNISLLVYQEDIYVARMYPVDDTEKRSIVTWSPLSRRVFENAKRSPWCFHRCASDTLPVLRIGPHVRRNSDPAGISIASGISKTDCVGGCASDLWCNANLLEFYSLLLLSPSRAIFFVYFSSLSIARSRSRHEGDDDGGVRTEERTK